MVSIAAVGDICLGDHYFNVGHGMGSLLESTRLDSICKDVADVFSGSDIVFGNLESPLRQSKKHSSDIGDAVFVGRASVARELALLGFNALNVANNHILQHGEDVFHETIASLIDSGISPIGLVDQVGYYCKPVRFTASEKIIGLLGYSDVSEVYGRQPTPYAQFDPVKVAADIQKMKTEVDAVAVSLHFGTEGIALPTSDAIRKARWLIESGADIVLGHHPHVFQPIEKYKNGLIIYSMGNFIFDLFWRKDYVESAVAKVVVETNGDIDAAIIPIVLNDRRILKKLSNRAAGKFTEKNQSLLQVMSEANEAEYNRLIQNLIVRSDRYDAIAKSLHFFRHIASGNARMKVDFIRNKVLKKIGIA